MGKCHYDFDFYNDHDHVDDVYDGFYDDVYDDVYDDDDDLHDDYLYDDNENVATHLNDMVVDPDATVTAGDGVFDDPLNIDVQLVCKRMLSIYFHNLYLYSYLNLN